MMAAAIPPNGHQMIRTAKIHNFKCFRELGIEGFRRVNVIVGDNGAGKTSLLEALFLALGVTPEVGVRFRQQRGLDTTFSATNRQIEEALWRDMFYRRDWSHPVRIELTGDGQEARSVAVYRGRSQLTIPLQPDAAETESRMAPIVFEWRDSDGKSHVMAPKLSARGLDVESSDEDLPDFFYFASSMLVGSGENASRFSELRRAGRSREFIKIFTDEFRWIENLDIEVVAGSPVIYATLNDGEMLPLTNVSGGINRIIGVMLAVARQRGIVLVDELEDGLYFKHHGALWRALLTLARTNESQLIITTHNEEWLGALFEVSGETSDIALWRIERSKKGEPVLRQFSGTQTAAALKSGDVR